ncbi:TetR/AcrR family transcriptional regulator [Streptomyces mirabilis]|uniref:TetR/AcrR family transcriptional regulator n=1 Tax=Streptomyces mirabilis TaxID=68239 RepID=UPI00365A5623
MAPSLLRTRAPHALPGDTHRPRPPAPHQARKRVRTSKGKRLMDTQEDTTVVVERSDAACNRARLLEAAGRLVAEHGAERVTMEAIAKEAGVGKGTVFRRFGDRGGLLLALLAAVEADFQRGYESGPPPLGPGAPAGDRLTAFGCALIERIASDTDPGVALTRQMPRERRYISEPARAHHRHVATLLREAGVDGDPHMLAHALLTFLDTDAVDHMRHEGHVPVARLRAAWADLVQRVLPPDDSSSVCGEGCRRERRSGSRALARP